MASGVADPNSRDKGLHGAFVVVSLLSHAAVVTAFALVGRVEQPGAAREPAAPAAQAQPTVEVVEEDEARAHDTEIAVDEVAGRSGPAPAATPEPTAEPPSLAPTEPAPEPPPPPRAPAPARPKAPPPPRASAAPSASASAAPAASASAGPSGEGSGRTDQEGAGHALKAPDLAKRFTKELPAYAYAVEGWGELADGDVGPIELTISLDERGKVIHDKFVIEQKPPPPPALAESVTRAVRSLRMTLALPGHPVRAGTLKLSVRARVKHGTPRADIQKFRIEADLNASRAEFELESGLLVVFDVKVGAVATE